MDQKEQTHGTTINGVTAKTSFTFGQKIDRVTISGYGSRTQFDCSDSSPRFKSRESWPTRAPITGRIAQRQSYPLSSRRGHQRSSSAQSQDFSENSTHRTTTDDQGPHSEDHRLRRVKASSFYKGPRSRPSRSRSRSKDDGNETNEHRRVGTARELYVQRVTNRRTFGDLLQRHSEERCEVLLSESELLKLLIRVKTGELEPAMTETVNQVIPEIISRHPAQTKNDDDDDNNNNNNNICSQIVVNNSHKVREIVAHLESFSPNAPRQQILASIPFLRQLFFCLGLRNFGQEQSPVPLGHSTNSPASSSSRTFVRRRRSLDSDDFDKKRNRKRTQSPNYSRRTPRTTRDFRRFNQFRRGRLRTSVGMLLRSNAFNPWRTPYPSRGVNNYRKGRYGKMNSRATIRGNEFNRRRGRMPRDRFNHEQVTSGSSQRLESPMCWQGRTSEQTFSPDYHKTGDPVSARTRFSPSLNALLASTRSNSFSRRPEAVPCHRTSNLGAYDGTEAVDCFTGETESISDHRSTPLVNHKRYEVHPGPNRTNTDRFDVLEASGSLNNSSHDFCNGLSTPRILKTRQDVTSWIFDSVSRCSLLPLTGDRLNNDKTNQFTNSTIGNLYHSAQVTNQSIITDFHNTSNDLR